MASADINARDLTNQLNRMTRELNQVGRVHVNRGTARVLNRLANSGKTIAVREASQRLGIKQKNIRPRIKVYKASARNLTAKLWSGSFPISARALGAKQTAFGFQYGDYLWPGAFKARVRAGNNGQIVEQILMRHPHRTERGPVEGPHANSGRKSGYPLQKAELGSRVIHPIFQDAIDKGARSVVSDNFPRLMHQELHFRHQQIFGSGR